MTVIHANLCLLKSVYGIMRSRICTRVYVIVSMVLPGKFQISPAESGAGENYLLGGKNLVCLGHSALWLFCLNCAGYKLAYLLRHRSDSCSRWITKWWMISTPSSHLPQTWSPTSWHLSLVRHHVAYPDRYFMPASSSLLTYILEAPRPMPGSLPTWSNTRCATLMGLSESTGKEDPTTQPAPPHAARGGRWGLRWGHVPKAQGLKCSDRGSRLCNREGTRGGGWQTDCMRIMVRFVWHLL